jgi:hypothetical protein
MGALPADVRLTYIGLWCVADDAGWMTWDVDQIAALLYPYESIRSRTRRVERAEQALREAGRLFVYECGCAVVPKLPEHQKIGGTKSFTSRDKHESIHVRTNPPVTLGNGRVGNGRVETGASAREKEELLESFRRRGMPVDAA